MGDYRRDGAPVPLCGVGVSRAPKPIKFADAASAAEGFVELRALRQAIEATKQRAVALSAGLIAYLDERHIDVFDVEGIPLAHLRESTMNDYDLASLVRDHPGALEELLAAGALKVVFGKVQEGVSSRVIKAPVKRYRHPVGTKREIRYDRDDDPAAATRSRDARGTRRRVERAEGRGEFEDDAE